MKTNSLGVCYVGWENKLFRFDIELNNNFKIDWGDLSKPISVGLFNFTETDDGVDIYHPKEDREVR